MAKGILKRENKRDKLGILDVLIKCKSGKLINVEIQVDTKEWIHERIVFYNSKLIAVFFILSRYYNHAGCITLYTAVKS